ncbi:MAG: hypothetical protein ACRBI6_11220 [Acidimicrobiales bacterium]
MATNTPTRTETSRTVPGGPTSGRSPERQDEGSGGAMKWVLAAVAAVVLAVILFFALGGDADIDAEPGSVDVDAPSLDVDVDGPDIDAEAPDIDVDPGSVDIEDGNAEADAG